MATELKTVKDVKLRRSEILDELKAYTKASELAKRQFTKEERDKTVTLRAEDDQLKAQLAELEAAEKADDETRAWVRGQEAVQDKSAGRHLAPEAGSTLPTVAAEPKKPHFRTFGEQLQAIANVAISGRDDPRLTWQQLAPISGGATSGLPSDGGYLVQKDFSDGIISRIYEFGQLLSRVRKVPIGSNSDGLKLFAVDETSRATGSRWGGIQVYWGAEADSATAKKPKFRMMELELKDLIGLAYMTERLLQDASAIEAIFQQGFSEEMSFMLEDAIINGTGAGQPFGIVNSGAIVSVAKETGQATATLVSQNVIKMWSRMWGRSRQNAIWLINQDVETQLQQMNFGIGTGGVPVFLQPGGLSQSAYSTLFGRPVIPVEYCATLGTTGDILLLDLSQYIMIDKGGLQSDSSIHVRFITNERTFRYIYRADGQPIWNSVLTPFKGSNTLSPFVKCDTR